MPPPTSEQEGNLGTLASIARSPGFAYGSILLIGLRALWGINEHRDLSAGDSADYFIRASKWAADFELDPVWSPLYDFYWGSLKWVVPGAYDVTILHRVLIAVAASLLVLAVLRRLLTPGIAWVLAAWFSVNPVNYDTIYEVHLFSLLPALVAVLVALSWTGLRMRATVFGILLAAALLQRNEMLIAALAWAAIWGTYEIWLRRRRLPAPSAGRLARAAAIPIAVVAVIGLAVFLSYSQRGAVRELSELKHELNVCQTYAFGYQQRHDDFTGSPWTDCGDLIERDFDTESISFAGAFTENPGAMIEHMLWNARLVPHGLQLLLFDRTAASPGWNPDYIVISSESTLALAGSIAVAIVLAAGLFLVWRQRRRWWEERLRDTAWGWAALACLALTALAVMITQRPRPSYMFALEVGILALVGIAAMALSERLPWSGRLRAAPLLLAPLVLIALPQHYDSGYETPNVGSDRPIKAEVERLEPRADELRDRDIVLEHDYAREICAYVGEDEPCRPRSVAVSETGPSE